MATIQTDDEEVDHKIQYRFPLVIGGEQQFLFVTFLTDQ